MASVKYWVWLAALRGVPNVTKIRLLQHFEEPDSIYFADKGEYLLVEGMTREAAEALESKSTRVAEWILRQCEKLGLQILTYRDGMYPDLLRNIYDPPVLLYAKGRVPLFDEEVGVAMVGSRRASQYALEAGERLAGELAGYGAVVVSGMAAGADSAAHRGALKAGGVTVGVIGCGHDVIYPSSSKDLYEDLPVRGAILSEYPPGTRPDGSHFPVRNRILSGICRSVVVMEAPARSGALITAARALEQGKDVFAIPGRMGDWHCAGSNLLLRDGAGVITDAWDVLESWADRFPLKLAGRKRSAPQPEEDEEEERPAPEPEKAPDPLPTLRLSAGEGNLSDDQIAILRYLEGHPDAQVDDMIDATGILTRRVLSALTVLEIDGYVAQAPGKRFTLAVKLA